MSPAHSVCLIATALIVASVPLDTAALILFYYTLFWPLPFIFSLPYCNSQGPYISQYSVRNKSFDTLNYYALEIIPYFLNASIVACPSWTRVRIQPTTSTRLCFYFRWWFERSPQSNKVHDYTGTLFSLGNPLRKEQNIYKVNFEPQSSVTYWFYNAWKFHSNNLYKMCIAYVMNWYQDIPCMSSLNPRWDVAEITFTHSAGLWIKRLTTFSTANEAGILQDQSAG
jgi:hypothetical protein